MSANGVRHFLDLIDIPSAELRGMIAESCAIKAKRKTGGDSARPLAGKIARSLGFKRLADRRHGDGGGRQHRRYASQRLERRHRDQRRASLLERRGRARPQDVHRQGRADEGDGHDRDAEDDAARVHSRPEGSGEVGTVRPVHIGR